MIWDKSGTLKEIRVFEKCLKYLKEMVIETGFEPVTYCLEGRYQPLFQPDLSVSNSYISFLFHTFTFQIRSLVKSSKIQLKRINLGQIWDKSVWWGLLG